MDNHVGARQQLGRAHSQQPRVPGPRPHQVDGHYSASTCSRSRAARTAPAGGSKVRSPATPGVAPEVAPTSGTSIEPRATGPPTCDAGRPARSIRPKRRTQRARRPEASSRRRARPGRSARLRPGACSVRGRSRPATRSSPGRLSGIRFRARPGLPGERMIRGRSSR